MIMYIISSTWRTVALNFYKNLGWETGELRVQFHKCNPPPQKKKPQKTNKQPDD